MAQPDSQSRRADELKSYEVIDCDCHYMESFADVAEYMEEPWKTRFEKSDFDEKGAKQNLSSFFPFTTGDRQAHGKIEREHSSYPNEPETPERIREGMASIGVNKTLLISHLILAGAGITADDDRHSAFAKAYVDYMQDEVLDPDDGIYGLAPIPYSDINAAHEVLDKIEGKEAYKGACFVTSGASLPLGNRKYDPLYERCEDMELPAVFHTGGAGLDEYVRGGYEEMIETHTLGFLESNMSQIVSLVCRGVPEKFPDLDIAFMESGITYLPGLIARLDEEYLKRPEEAPMLEKKPGEYITDFYYGTQPLEISADPEFLAKCIDMVGTDSLLYASDYPHWDFDRPTTVLDLPSISEQEKRSILHENAAEVFDL